MLSIYLAILGASIVLLVLTPWYSYLSKRPNHKILTLTIKGLNTGASLLFAIIGYIRLVNLEMTSVPKNLIQNYWILVGLSICLVADLVLRIHILAGGVLFFFGHVAYIIFFLSLTPLNAVSILIFTILCVVVLCYFYRYSPMLDGLKVPVTLYGIIICASLSLGIVLPFTFGVYGCLPAIAILLLVCSDFMLARNKMVIETPLTRTLALLFYFAGQFVMAMTLYLPSIFG